MSYVDLMSNVRWTERQHLARTQAMVRQAYSFDDELVLIRIMLGKVAGLYTPTPDEEAQVANMQQVLLAARQAGVEGRADAAKLAAALDIEALKAAVDAIPPTPQPTDEDPNPVDPYADQRATAQVAYDTAYQAATPDVQQLLADRAAYLRVPSARPVEEPQ